MFEQLHFEAISKQYRFILQFKLPKYYIGFMILFHECGYLQCWFDSSTIRSAFYKIFSCPVYIYRSECFVFSSHLVYEPRR